MIRALRRLFGGYAKGGELGPRNGHITTTRTRAGYCDQCGHETTESVWANVDGCTEPVRVGAWCAHCKGEA